jgi:chemotaxis protein methyltransferase CheR
VKETYFFRDAACFQALEHTILPSLVRARREDRRQSLHVWSAGCATGEEAYSLAILVDRLLPDRQAWEVTVLATDIDVKALAEARRGRYRAWSFREMAPSLRDASFVRRSSGHFELDPRIRGMVSFEPDNVSSGGPRGPIDLILCRNSLMYLGPSAAQAAIERLRSSLAEDGWLAVSPAEASAERFRPLVPVNLPGALFFRRPRSEAVREVGVVAPRSAESPARHARRAPQRPSARPRERHEPRAAEPTEAQERLARARALADAGALEEALAVCKEALARDRLLAGAHCLIGVIHQERGDVEAAVKALRRAVYLDSDSAEAHAVLGHLLLKRGEGRRGRKHIETAARLLAGRAEAS